MNFVGRVLRRSPVIVALAAGIALLPAASASAVDCKSTARLTSVLTTHIDAQSVGSSNFCPVGGPSGSPGELTSWKTWATTGAVKVNGIVLTPAAGTSIRIDRAKQVVSSFDAGDRLGGSVSGALPVTSSFSIPLGSFEGIRECRREVREPGKPPVVVCETRSGISWDFNATASHEIRIGKYAPPTGMDLGFLPVSGRVELRTATRKSIIAVNIELPNWFSATPGSSVPITGGAQASVTNSGKVKFEGVRISIPSAYIGTVEIADLLVSYKASSPAYPKGLWTGKFKLRGLPGGGELDATGDKPYGIAFAPPTSFEYAGAKFTPGSPILVASNVFLAKIDASFHRDPLTIVGKGEFLIGPSPKTPAVGVDAGAMIGFGTEDHPAKLADLDPADSRQFDSLTVFASGKARLFNRVDFASGHVLYVYPAFVEVEGSVDYTILDALRIRAAAKAQINFKSWEYMVTANADLCTGNASWIPRWFRNECAGGDFILSSRGIGGCLRWKGPDIGGYYQWSGSWRFSFYGCDVRGALNVTVSARKAGRASAAAAISPINVAGNDTGLLVAVTSKSGLPAFDLVAPSGRRISVPGSDPGQQFSLSEDVRILFSPRRDRTISLAVDSPEVGAWRVVPRPGSPRIDSVKRGVILPEPSVEGSLSGSGRNLRLDYSVAKIPGQTVEFVIKGERTLQTIGTDSGRGGNGTIRFAPDSGPAGQRQVVALIKSYDTVRREVELGGFDSPGPVPPAVPQVTVSRAGTNLKVSWTGAGTGDRASARVQLTDGRSLLLTTRKSSVTFSGVDSDVGGVVAVRFVRDGYLISPESLSQLPGGQSSTPLR